MKLDKRAVERLLALNDEQLRAVITRLAGENGIDLSGLQIRPDDIRGVRQALQMATDEDIARAAAQLGLVRGARKPQGGGD
ncbi:MAG: hypothetical protein IJW97_02595 [Clostridia bacterium]|nr:hypothetical protein [Clostridia bacterium]